MKTYARIDQGIVVELLHTEGNIAEMFHPDLVWIDVTDMKPCRPDGGAMRTDSFRRLRLSLRPCSRTSQRARPFMAAATLAIAPLQDAVDLDEATAEEVARLTAWKQCRIALNRMEITAGNLSWPIPPAR
ncbi:tail fiber assembly protein [Cupriavidus respiraculi]|uniref:tail fiber assembly protein n=1 Tax=Cupriavidus respiraculi TaxID=195930 RepID=UPI001CC496C1|nr:tail fiber assembly protein [Cupriavidus respiraculi]